MGVKNSSFRVAVETSVKEKVKLQAFEEGVSISEFIRQRVREKPKLDKIEIMLEKLLKRKNY